MKKKKRIFIIGPTGVGKTELSLFIAENLPGQIISMDSMQIYRGMDIGTAKATRAERELVSHYMLDVAEPAGVFTAYDYKTLALTAEEKIREKGMTPIFVGGTGLYLNSLIYDYNFASAGLDIEMRRDLENKYELDGGLSLYRELKERDPETAAGLSINDRPRVIRALIIHKRSGIRKSEAALDRLDKNYDNFIIQLSLDRKVLYEKINKRVDKMFELGLLDEVKGLMDKSIDLKSQAMQAIGYREAVWYLRGLVSYREMKELIKRFSRNYAKRQETWFRKSPVSIKLDLSKEKADFLIAKLRNFIAEK